ncbi:MAG: LytTR family transcriptional regulator [Rhodobacteraceae bacterium]|nr:LytTR family transcriptional regulator [Paracoccaceae bacterium]
MDWSALKGYVFSVYSPGFPGKPRLTKSFYIFNGFILYLLADVQDCTSIAKVEHPLLQPNPKSSSILTRLESWRSKHFDQGALHLGLTYQQILASADIRWKLIFRAARQIITLYFLTYELYVLVLGLVLLLITTGAFIQPGVEIGMARPVFIGILTLITVALPALLHFFLLPLHIIFQARLWVLTLIHSLLASVILSGIEPWVGSMILPVQPLGFSDIFLPNLVIYLFSIGIITLRVRDTVSYSAYKNRHDSSGIDSLLPPALRGKLAYISAQDHYVKIVTLKGEHLHRMPFSAAVKMLGNTKGMLVHRSHWVSCNAMLILEKSADKYALKLRDGTCIPVAKSKFTQVQTYLDTR